MKNQHTWLTYADGMDGMCDLVFCDKSLASV